MLSLLLLTYELLIGQPNDLNRLIINSQEEQ